MSCSIGEPVDGKLKA